MMAAHVICQLEIDHLFAELHDKDATLIEALRDRNGYRQLAQAALARIATLTIENDRLRRRLAESAEERRRVSSQPRVAA